MFCSTSYLKAFDRQLGVTSKELLNNYFSAMNFQTYGLNCLLHGFNLKQGF